MTRSTIAKRVAPGLAVLGCVTALTPLASQAAKKGEKPVAVTGTVTHVRGTSAELDGTVVPGAQTTSYYFKYGPTIAYGLQTIPATLPAGKTTVKVGQTVAGFLVGYHYRLVATSSIGTAEGRDRAFTTTALKSKITLVKPTVPTVFGRTLAISGTLVGPGNANRRIELQSSAYPYLLPFAAVGVPSVSNAAGAFSFRVAGLTTNTQFRVATLDPRPLYSPVITEQIAVRVTLKVRTSSRPGLVRLYGTVTPAKLHAQVFFQLQGTTRPHGDSEQTTKFTNKFSTRTLSATKAMSRFSSIVSVRSGGRYRAYVQLGKGPLASGSSTTVILHSAPAATKH